jgi:hypothetical protein
MNSYWKSSMVALVAAAAMVGSAGLARAQACGDANNSGTPFEVGDCIRIGNIVSLVQPQSAACGGVSIDCADLNGDDALSVGDVVLCQNKVAGAPDPFTLCTGPGSAIACPATISADITQNQIWPIGCQVTLDGLVFVQPGITLTIKEGVTVRGMKTPSPPDSVSALVFLRGSKGDVQGTLDSPVVFTSDALPNFKASGDWGGLVINGRSTTNVPGGIGLAEGLVGVQFGGTDAADSSGTFRFIRVEFAGRTLSTDNELNLFTMNGLGTGTTIENIETLVGNDDCFEWFGGTVNGKFLAGVGCKDDGLDWQLGYTGSVQFAYYEAFEAESASGSNGFEADNNENGYNNLPRSAPRFCNVTLIGANGMTGAGANSADGALLRRGTAGTIANSIIMRFGRRGITLDNDQTSQQICSGALTLRNDGPAITQPAPLSLSPLAIAHSIFFSNVANAGGTPAPCSGSDAFTLWDSTFNNSVTDPGIADTTFPVADPRPSNATPMSDGGLNCAQLSSYFVDAVTSVGSTRYIGAFDPTAANWLNPTGSGNWISFDTNG